MLKSEEIQKQATLASNNAKVIAQHLFGPSAKGLADQLVDEIVKAAILEIVATEAQAIEEKS